MKSSHASAVRNRWVLITGASSGFGAASALAFGAAGAHLLLGARRTALLRKVGAAARKAGAASVQFRELDVSKTSSVCSFLRWVRARTKKVDVLINNAGGALGIDPVAAGKDQDWEMMLQSNVLGLLRMCRGTLPLMLQNPGSYIINIGSVAGHTAYEGGAAYCGAKAAERSITQALRLELCGTGVRVGSVDPGMAKTEFALVRFKGDTARAEKLYEGMEPLTAEDVAETLVWVASRPPHVCIDELIIKCTDQAAVHKLHRRTARA